MRNRPFAKLVSGAVDIVLAVVLASLGAMLGLIANQPIGLAVDLAACTAAALAVRWPRAAGIALGCILAVYAFAPHQWGQMGQYAPLIAILGAGMRGDRRLRLGMALGYWLIYVGIQFTVYEPGLTPVFASLIWAALIAMMWAVGNAFSNYRNAQAKLREAALTQQRLSLARDLHDSVKQQVFAVSMNLAAAQALWERDPQAARQRLDIATEVSRQTQQELTTLIQTLRPPQLSEKSLPAALDELVRQWARQNNCRAAFRVEGSPQPLHPETEQAFFRMAQEALSNIARHSRASTVEMALTFNHDTAALEVRDDGQGFDPNQPVSGLGLRSMRERIHALGGVFSVESRPGSTHLSAQIPVLSPDRNTEVKHE